MAIIKQPNKPVRDTSTSAADAFISVAPDAGVLQAPKPNRVRKGKRVQISLTIAEPLLDRVDQAAAELGQSRAAIINLAIMQMLQSGLRINGND